LVPHVSSTFASTAFRPTFVTTRTPLVSGWNDENSTSEYQKLQEANLRQNGTTGKLHMIDMRNLPLYRAGDCRSRNLLDQSTIQRSRLRVMSDGPAHENLIPVYT
jgi:hypothetical protein